MLQLLAGTIGAAETPSERRNAGVHEGDLLDAYSTAVVGEETPDHLIRRITAPRGMSATA